MNSDNVNNGKAKFLLPLAIAIATSAQGQNLPGSTRTVYKCEANGKVIYSDTPCLGAKRLEMEPSRGIGKNVGADVQRELQREMFADAIKPLTGMNAKELDAHGRRTKLSSAAHRECNALDTKLVQVEQAEASLSGEKRDAASQSLFSLRERYRELRC